MTLNIPRLGKFLLIFFGCCLSLPILSAEPEAQSPYLVDMLGVSSKSPREKLPSRAVIAVTQTHDGYLWVGTFKGLARYDGVNFTVLNQGNTPGLKSDLIVFLFEDSRGWLWVGTGDGGVTLVRGGQVHSLPVQQGTSSGRLMSACEDTDGSVWLYFSDGMLWRYAEGQLARINIAEDFGSLCRSVIAERNGLVWVGADGGQIGLGVNAPTNSPPPQIVAGKLDFLLASRNGGYWRLADNRIEKWVGDTRTNALGFYPWTNAPNVRVTSACEDREGNLIVGVLNDGIYWFDATGTATHISTANGLSHPGVLSVCVDREGNLWAGTDGGGLNRIKRRVGTVARGAASVVQSASEDADGALWVGFTSGGIMRSKDDEVSMFGWSNRFRPEDGLISPNILSVFADRAGQVWASTRAPGALHRFREGRFEVIRETVGPDIQAIYQDRSGVLWLGTQGGLIGLDGDRWRVITTQDGLSAPGVQAIAEDVEGNLWIGTAGGGLNRLREGKLTAIHGGPDALPGDNVTALLADTNNILWVGTGSGLARLKSGKWTQFTTRDGLVSDSISYLLDDEEGFLWAGSNLGLMRIAKQSLEDFAEGRTQFVACRSYDESDGLPSGECTSGSQPAALRTKEGRLWFPTIGGLAGINPSKLRWNTNPPPVVIESVLIDGRPQLTNGLRAPLPGEIIVGSDAERLEFHFASLNLAAPERALFRYQLEGHESSLSEPRDSRFASFSKLPPGEYRFHVIAANEDGIWNEKGSSIAVRVLPPFWREWWFLTGSGAALLAFVVGVVYWFSTQKLHRQLAALRQKEALERERSRIARDLHDQLGANLTRVSLLSELVETDKDEPTEVEAHARQITQTAAETAHALDEIVWAANPSNDTLEGLVNYLCKYAQEFLTTAGLRCRLDVPPNVAALPIAPDTRHSLFLVAKEALNNVVKHAGAKEVQLQIKVEPKQFTVEITDDGQGPAGALTAEKRGRNGLRNMRRRMEDAGGSFKIESAKPKGTRVRLKAPLVGI